MLAAGCGEVGAGSAFAAGAGVGCCAFWDGVVLVRVGVPADWPVAGLVTVFLGAGAGVGAGTEAGVCWFLESVLGFSFC